MAGSQFDPRVVEAFLGAAEERRQGERRQGELQPAAARQAG